MAGEGRRNPKDHKAIRSLAQNSSLASGKQFGRYFSSDVVDGEGVLAKLLVFLECSDSHYIDNKFGIVLQYVFKQIQAKSNMSELA